VSKNKLKFVIFLGLFSFFLLFNVNLVSAQDYNVSVESVNGLVYGNKLKDAIINGNSDVEGEFSFYNQEMVLEDIGEIELEIVFIPKDSSNIKKININAEVLKRKVYVVFDTPIYKQYNGLASIELPNYHYEGIIDDEVTIEGELYATLQATYVGEGIPLVLSGVNIVGEKSDCYELDLFEHSARVYPSFLEKEGENATKIELEKDVYVDVGYRLKVVKEDVENLVNEKYTSFLKFSYDVYSYNNVKLNIDSKYDISMKIDESVLNVERLEVFELMSNGEYKELEYTYKDGIIFFEIESDSSLVFATRNIEYQFIILFCLILIFSFIFIVVYRIKNSRIKEEINF